MRDHLRSVPASSSKSPVSALIARIIQNNVQQRISSGSGNLTILDENAKYRFNNFPIRKIALIKVSLVSFYFLFLKIYDLYNRHVYIYQ